MRHALTFMFAISTSFFSTVAIAQEGRPCSQLGQVVTIAGKTYTCSPAAGQARNPNWDGASRERTQGEALPRPSAGGAPIKQVAFPGISNDEYKKLQNSAKGQELIKQAESLRNQKAEAQSKFDAAARSGDAKQLSAATKNLDAVNANLNGMQKKAQNVLVELR